MIVKKLRRPCLRCNKKFVPSGKTQRICFDCYLPRGNIKGINIMEVRKCLKLNLD